tara:strand:+ start:6588 stop:8366 length:1779 start_codon:yes stop_codon:yes gene_type:complete
MVTVCDEIAEFLEKKNIKILFGITGGTNVFLFDAIMRRGFTKVVYVHHEQAAVMSAGAYYRASGNLAGVIVTAGGGASNAITGTLSNWADSIPCLIMSGQEGTGYVKDHEDLRMLGTQGFNVTDSVKNMTKYAKCITDENDVLFHLDKAYHICTEGRPGPVWLDIPGNIQNLKIDKDTVSRFSPPADHDQSKIDLDDIVKLLENSKRPVIMAGHGISLSKNNKQFRELVDKFNIPVLLTYSGINILEHEHPLNFGTSGLYGQRRSNFIVQNCDLLLVLGSRLAIPQVGYNIENFARDAKIIMVNNDVGELKKISRCVPVHADCKDFIESLSNHELNKNYGEWVARCKKYSDDFPIIENHHLKDNKVYDNSYVLINELSDLLPADNIISIGQGSPLPCTHQAFKFKKNQIAFASNGLGEMGNGLPSAIGASFSNTKTHTILLDGDGSMMMNLQELQTIVGYNLPLKILVFNNQGYLFIKHTQKMLFGKESYTGVDAETGLSLPNFEKIANAFNIPYMNTKTNTLHDFVNHEGYCIFECFMNPEQDLSPKVKGVKTDDGIIAPPIEDMSPLIPLETLKSNMIIDHHEISDRLHR